MKTPFPQILACSLLISVAASCTKPQQPVMVLAPPAKSGLVIGDPLDCGLPELLIFPIGSSYAPEVYAGNDNSSPDIRLQGSLSWAYNAVGSGDVMNDRYASIEYVNPADKGYDISNVLFYNKRTGESHPLHLDTLHILSFAIHKEFKTPRIFYRAVRTDLNGDTLFNGLDPVILFASKLDGDSLVQLTPSGQQFVDYH
jgi:hypothetical protein